MRERHTDFGEFGRGKLLRYLAAGILTGLGAGFIGPYGTYEFMNSGPRYFYWISIITLGWTQMLFISYGMRAVLMRPGLPGSAVMLAAAAVGSVPILFEVRWMAAFLLGDEVRHAPIWLTYIQVYFITVICSLLQWVVIERWSLATGLPLETGTAPQGPQKPAHAKFLRISRMPDGLNGSILCLEMEDHYVRVHTEEGSGLVLHRLIDAVRELSEDDGMQVHRSWWVASKAVERVETENRQRFLILSNGLRVPVSRNHLPAVRKAGWIN